MVESHLHSGTSMPSSEDPPTAWARRRTSRCRGEAPIPSEQRFPEQRFPLALLDRRNSGTRLYRAVDRRWRPAWAAGGQIEDRRGAREARFDVHLTEPIDMINVSQAVAARLTPLVSNERSRRPKQELPADQVCDE